MIGVEIPSGIVEDALYWDTADPYHYVRLEQSRKGGNDILLVGGEDHKTGQFPERGCAISQARRMGSQAFSQGWASAISLVGSGAGTG